MTAALGFFLALIATAAAGLLTAVCERIKAGERIPRDDLPLTPERVTWWRITDAANT